MGRWLDIYSDGRVYEMDGDTPLKLIDTKGEVKLLLQLLQATDAGMFTVAPASKIPPKIDVSTTNERAIILITKLNTMNADNLVNLQVSLIKGGKILDQITAVSGQPRKQNFRTPSMSRAGSMEPLPEGYWKLGTVEWASGVKGDYSKNWPEQNDGLGPIWVDMICTAPTERSAIGFHFDNNAGRAPGTVGCVGISVMADLKKFVGWFDDPRFAPKMAVVNWGLGTVETPIISE